VLERRNWTVLNSADLHAPSSAPIRARIGEIDPADAGTALSLRVERQTLRRLPQTGAALFTIRVWLAPLGSLRDDPGRLAAFAHAWRTAHPDLRAYSASTSMTNWWTQLSAMLKAGGRMQPFASRPPAMTSSSPPKQIGSGAVEAVMVFETMNEPETGQYLSEAYAFCRRWSD